ncbi:MAG: hypothetical protein QNJ62_05220 [Methyloceanibacter sp.]|nr:hypothetical protein [Methyloceanibacter sp.]
MKLLLSVLMLLFASTAIASPTAAQTYGQTGVAPNWMVPNHGQTRIQPLIGSPSYQQDNSQTFIQPLIGPPTYRDERRSYQPQYRPQRQPSYAPRKFQPYGVERPF